MLRQTSKEIFNLYITTALFIFVIIDFLSLKVPHGCYNGTFWWDYPRGFVILDFTKYNKPTSICFADYGGGGAFTITDKIHDVQLDPLRWDSGKC